MKRFILNFHGIGTPRRSLEPGESPYWISETFFEQLLERVSALPCAGQVSYTFDDGNLSDYDIGAQALNARGLSATFFVLSARIGDAGSLDAAHLQQMRDMGHTIGLHGADHVDWTALDTQGCEREFGWARSQLEDIIGQPVTAAAIPFGRYRRPVLVELKKRGFTTVYSSDGGHWRPGQYPIPRMSLHKDMTLDGICALLQGHEPAKARLRRRLSMAVKKRI